MEQFKVAVPYEKRIPGWIYDHDSGTCVGIASDEQRAQRLAGVPFKERKGNGCIMQLVIHPGYSSGT